MTEVWLVRHGETEWSKSGRHTGVTDLALTPDGEKQARATADELAGVRFDLVMCSPRLRARQTAEIASAATLARDGTVHIEDDLAEWDYGSYEGRTSTEIWTTDPGWTIFTRGAPGGESPAAVVARVRRLIGRCDAAGPDARVLLVAHGHILRALATQWIEQPIELGDHLLLDTAAVSVMGVDRGSGVLLRWNCS